MTCLRFIRDLKISLELRVPLSAVCMIGGSQVKELKMKPHAC